MLLNYIVRRVSIGLSSDTHALPFPLFGVLLVFVLVLVKRFHDLPKSKVFFSEILTL